MSSKKNVVEKKKLNIWALVSLLLILLVPPLFLIPWYDLFVLRSDTITTLFIHFLGILVVGFAMLITGIISALKNRKHAGTYKGSWMGVVGIVLGTLLVVIGLFFVIDYLTFTAA